MGCVATNNTNFKQPQQSVTRKIIQNNKNNQQTQQELNLKKYRLQINPQIRSSTIIIQNEEEEQQVDLIIIRKQSEIQINKNKLSYSKQISKQSTKQGTIKKDRIFEKNNHNLIVQRVKTYINNQDSQHIQNDKLDNSQYGNKNLTQKIKKNHRKQSQHLNRSQISSLMKM